MTHVRAFSPLLLAALVSASFTAAAANPSKDELAGRTYIGAHLGAMDLDQDYHISKFGNPYQVSQNFKAFVPGVELGYRLNKDWGVRGYYDYLQADLRGTGRSGYGDSYGVDVIYNIDNTFYTGLGLNSTKVENRRDTFARLTAGARHFVSDNLALKAEAAVQQNDSNLTNVIASVGLQYFFGGSNHYSAPTPAPQPAPAPKPVAQPVDSDHDGVIDTQDACPGTPAGYAVDSRGCTKYQTQTVSVKLLVNFPVNSAKVAPQYYPQIEKVAKFMKDFPELNVVIEGYTDDTGAAKYNLKLSQRRASAVGDVLASQFNIDKSRIKTVGYGETRPAVEGTSKAARAANRRIEAKLSAEKKVPEAKN